jgi:alpha-ketoglutarate-dependent 2,4-dichlorophenoxyacetate dioxygenase
MTVEHEEITVERPKIAVSIRPADPARPDFFAEVEGIDLRQPPNRESITAIEAGMDRFAALLFRDQRIDDVQQLAFSRNFGTLEQFETADISTALSPRRMAAFLSRWARNEFKRLRRQRGARKPHMRALGTEVADISELDSYNQMVGQDHPRRLFTLRNMLWHSDSSFRPTPAKYAFLHARVVPSAGGSTEFADMRAAYDALDDETRATIQDLVCEHSQLYSRGALGVTDFTDRERARWAPVPQRLVRRHPVTGRRSLYLSSHAGGIIGWPMPEARVLLRDLTEHATQREFVHAHEWRQYDLVMYDNRVTMHRGRRYDRTEVRELHRTMVVDIAPTLQQAA